jgi:hypothetical protein
VSALSIVFLVLWLITFGVLGVVVKAVRDDREQQRAEETINHANCIAHVAHVTSHRFIALWLRAAADRWDSMEEQPRLRRLADERYSPGGPSMPAIWMRAEADRLDDGNKAGAS